MCWNDGYERRTFEMRMKSQEKYYREMGMEENSIQEMYKFDLEMYRSERIFRMHTMPMSEFEDDNEQENVNPLQKKFMESMSIKEDLNAMSRFGWIENIQNQILYEALNNLKDNEKELLTILYVDEYSEEYASEEIYRIARQNVSKKKHNIYKKISLYFEKKEVLKNE